MHFNFLKYKIFLQIGEEKSILCQWDANTFGNSIFFMRKEKYFYSDNKVQHSTYICERNFNIHISILISFLKFKSLRVLEFKVKTSYSKIRLFYDKIYVDAKKKKKVGNL